MTKEQLLTDTIEYYTTHNRCVVNKDCMYSPKTLGVKNSDGCAIGRFLDPEIAYQIDAENNGISIKLLLNMDYELPEWIKNMDSDFLQSVQDLHDTDSYWEKRGLSYLGKQIVNAMIINHNLNVEPY